LQRIFLSSSREAVAFNQLDSRCQERCIVIAPYVASAQDFYALAGYVKARIGSTEIMLYKPHLEALRDFASRIAP
jgi:hypothetical protein